jgi:hypothetical protein
MGRKATGLKSLDKNSEDMAAGLPDRFEPSTVDVRKTPPENHPLFMILPHWERFK